MKKSIITFAMIFTTTAPISAQAYTDGFFFDNNYNGVALSNVEKSKDGSEYQIQSTIIQGSNNQHFNSDGSSYSWYQKGGVSIRFIATKCSGKDEYYGKVFIVNGVRVAFDAEVLDEGCAYIPQSQQGVNYVVNQLLTKNSVKFNDMTFSAKNYTKSLRKIYKDTKFAL